MLKNQSKIMNKIQINYPIDMFYDVNEYTNSHIFSKCSYTQMSDYMVMCM